MYKYSSHTQNKVRRSFMEKYRPGEIVPTSCDYRAYNEEGKDGGVVYLEKGKRFPATQHEGSYYVMEKNCK